MPPITLFCHKRQWAIRFRRQRKKRVQPFSGIQVVYCRGQDAPHTSARTDLAFLRNNAQVVAEPPCGIALWLISTNLSGGGLLADSRGECFVGQWGWVILKVLHVTCLVSGSPWICFRSAFPGFLLNHVLPMRRCSGDVSLESLMQYFVVYVSWWGLHWTVKLCVCGLDP